MPEQSKHTIADVALIKWRPASEATSALEADDYLVTVEDRFSDATTFHRFVNTDRWTGDRWSTMDDEDYHVTHFAAYPEPAEGGEVQDAS